MNRTPRKTAAQWAELVSEYSNGSQSERDFCTRHGIKLVTLRKWRYHYKAQNKIDTHQSPARFVKVNLRDERVPHDAAVLCIGTDIRLECPASYDVSSLAQLALAVHRGR
jgi:transposase-like protein